MKALAKIPNILTVLRICCSVALLFTVPLSAAFYIFYLVCGVSDLLDGYIARKYNVATNLGATLDSAADLIFFGILVIVFIRLFQWRRWILCCIGLTVIIRLLSIIVGFIKYHALACLHTYANKAAGALVFLFPFIYPACGFVGTAALLCSVILLSSIEELIINIVSKELHRDVRCIFDVFLKTGK